METEKPAPTSPADFDDDTKAALKNAGFNIDYSKIMKTVGGAFAGLAAYEFIRDPLGTGAAFAKDAAIEGAALAAKAPRSCVGYSDDSRTYTYADLNSLSLIPSSLMMTISSTTHL